MASEALPAVPPPPPSPPPAAAASPLMEVFFQRAKSFATEAAKRSQDLARDAAKFSHDIALQTAKRSKEIAFEASKTADQLKALAGEISSPSSIAALAARGIPTSSVPSEQELAEFGITAELREFISGLTINTFQDFPSEDTEVPAGVKDRNDIHTCETRQDLTEWQERHAVLVLKTVPDISQFRYLLCPRHMKESRFWKIYFTLVRSHVAPYEAQATAHGDTVAREQDEAVNISTPGLPAENSTSLSNNAEAAQKNSSTDDQDLDAYLLGALGSDADVEDDGYDADFDQLVNSTGLDSDTEQERNDSKISSLSSGKIVAASDGSSDGELVEIPELDPQTSAKSLEEL